MKLSILICTLPERVEFFKRLFTSLSAQKTPDVEICFDERDNSVPTGLKRNDLIKNSTGEYFCFIDDDDNVSSDYITLIMDGISKGVDVVTFCGWMTTNGSSKIDFVIKLGEAYEKRNGKYFRFPNHLCPMRRSVVDGIRFPDIWMGEDYAFAKKIADRKILKTEHHIEKQIYHYDFKTKEVPKPERRRARDRRILRK